MAEPGSFTEPRQSDWPLRPWLLAALLAAAGLAIHLLTNGGDDSPWRVAGAAFCFFGAISAGLTLDPGEWKEPAAFSAIAGLVMGGLAFHALDAGDHLSGEEFGLAAGVVATALAVPLFQAGFHRARFATPYRMAHNHAWSDAVSGALALAFTGLSWLVLALLDQLFRLVDITLIGELMNKGWFGWTFSGAAFGAGLGVLRNQLKVLGMLQAVVMLVLSLLAVPLALALLIFLVPLAISGGQVLWDATRSPTPILLLCAAGAALLANAVVREDDQATSPNRLLRLAAAALVAGILPLTVFAIISLGARVGQHGLSPERLWGLIATAVSVICGLAYWHALLRGGVAEWRAQLRQTNLRLAAGVAILALLLALPLVDFGAISTRNQLARLESGAVSAEDFDYDALRWDFGDAGRAALADLAKRTDKAVSEPAKLALASSDRYARFGAARARRLTKSLVTYPAGSAMPGGLKEAIAAEGLCAGEATCRVYLQADPNVVAVIGDSCAGPQGEATDDCFIRTEAFIFEAPEGWIVAPLAAAVPGMTPQERLAAHKRERAAIESGDVQIAPVRKREIYIGGKPSGRMLD